MTLKRGMAEINPTVDIGNYDPVAAIILVGLFGADQRQGRLREIKIGR